MNKTEILNKIKELFIKNHFELLDEHNEDSLSASFIKKDFRVEAYFDPDHQEYDLSLDRPFYGFSESFNVKNIDEITIHSEKFITRINQMIVDDEKLVSLTSKDCELFLKTGSYDGLASGLIEYKGSLYYITSITHTYLKDKCKQDSTDRVWRRFYVFELTKQELEKIVMSSLDWLRHINLTSLCKDWNSLRLETGNESEHKKFFDGKYNYGHEPKTSPVMKLTLFY